MASTISKPKPAKKLIDDAERERAYRSARLVAVRAWAFVGCCVAFVIAMRALGMVGSAIECLFVAVIVGFVCSPITNWLEKKGMARAGGALVALLVVIAVLAGLLLWLVPMFVEQLRQLLERVPGYIVQAQALVQDLWNQYGTDSTAEMQAFIQDFMANLGDLGTRMATSLASTISTGLVPNIMGVANGFVMGFLGLVMAYWFAKDYPVLMREIAVIAGPEYDEDVSLLVTVMSRSMGGYMKSIVITSIVNGLLAFLGFALLGHPYAGLMGVITGILHFVPVVGPAISAILATGVGFFTSVPLAIGTLIVAMIAQNVTDNVISPLIMQSTINIHPAMSLIGITVGASLGGALGMALAVPLTAAIKGVFIYFFEEKTARQLVSYDGAFFKGTPFHHPDGSPVPSYDALDDDTFLANTLLIEADELKGVEAEPAPEDTKPQLADVLRHQVEDFRLLHIIGDEDESASLESAGETESTSNEAASQSSETQEEQSHQE